MKIVLYPTQDQSNSNRYILGRGNNIFFGQLSTGIGLAINFDFV